METGWVIITVVGCIIVVFSILRHRTRAAMAILHAHSMTLSRITGIPSAKIFGEIIHNQETAGQWALRHGLDPLTFDPSATPSQHRGWVAPDGAVFSNRLDNANRTSRCSTCTQVPRFLFNMSDHDVMMDWWFCNQSCARGWNVATAKRSSPT